MKFSTLLLTVTLFSLSALASQPGLLTPVTGNLATSSFATGAFPFMTHFSPSGLFVSTLNTTDSTLSVFSVNQTTGVYTPVQTVTTLAGSAFSYAKNGTVAAVVNNATTAFLVGSVTSFTVNAAGQFTPSNGGDLTLSSGATSNIPNWVEYSPNSLFMAVAETGASVIEMFALSAAGTPTAIGLFATQTGPTAVTFSPDGRFLTAVNDQSLTVFSVAADGTLSYINGGLVNSSFPLPVNAGPVQGAYSPNGKFFSVAFDFGAFITVYAVNQATGSLTPINGTPANSSFPTQVILHRLLTHLIVPSFLKQTLRSIQ